MTDKVNPRVLMIGPSLYSRGGMATVERQLMDGLTDAGVPASFISTYDDYGKVKKALIALGAYAKFCRALKDVDIVHAHSASRGSYERKSLFLKKAMSEGKKTVVHLHGGEFAVWFDEEMDDGKREEVRALFNQVDAVVVLSEEWERWLVSRGFSPKRLVVMHNAVSVPERPCSPCARQGILFLGRLDARKSPDVLLRASRTMLSENPAAKLLFGGDGCPERYEALAEDLGIADRCEFLGWIAGEDKERLFERAGVYCLPSKNEGMPMSVLEAMAHGIPTIATPVGGVPQIIEDGVNGFLMPVGDEARLSELLRMLMGDPLLRARIGMEARRKVEDDFSLKLATDRLVDLYLCIASGLKGGRRGSFSE